MPEVILPLALVDVLVGVGVLALTVLLVLHVLALVGATRGLWEVDSGISGLE